VCVDSEAGDAATDAAFRRAAHVVRLETQINRVTGVPMEPRAALGVYDEASGRYTLYAGSGGSVRIKTDLAGTLGVPESAVRVVAREVGGNYGTRNAFYPEFALVAWAAKRLRRPVKWTCERREAFLTDYHARDLVSHAELALDGDGRFLALRGVNTSNVGAHAVSFIPLAKGIAVLPSVYHIAAASLRGRAVLSNTSPTYPYRSAGRPEVMFVIERLIDLAARHHGFDRVELRRRNLVPAGAMPYRNPVGLVYDSGDYAATQDRAVALADWAGFEARRAEARRRGRYRGIGLANYLGLNTGALRGPLAGVSDETVSVPSFPFGSAVCEVEVDPETGAVEVVRYTSVDDVGRAVNPLILEGQTHGGIAAGVGQALWERCHYDPETGQMQSATFMDYVVPRADMLPAFTTEISEVPSTSNPLGLRGGGEGGTTPALGAVVNALVDALAELGVEHIEMPAALARVWRAIRAAQAR